MEGIKIILMAALVTALGGCRALKRQENFQARTSQVSEEIIRSNERIVTEYFNDNLKARIPLPPLGRDPVVIPFESQGISLEISLTEGEMSFSATARPMARSVKETEITHESRQIDESEHRTEKKTQRRAIGMTWWIYALAGIILVLFLLMKLKKIKFPF